MSNFRLNSQQLFLTYPQCDVGKDVLQHHIEGHLPQVLKCDVVAYVICSEKHQDGEPHLHAYVKLSKKIDIHNPTVLDLVNPVGGKKFHGNYQGCRSAKSVIQYVAKDGDYKSKGIDVHEYIKASKGKKKYIAEKLIKREFSLVEAVDDEPSMLFHLDRLKTNLAVYHTLKAKESVSEKPAVSGIWLYGPPGIGKSTWVHNWARDKHLDIYDKEPSTKWFDGYSGQQVCHLNDLPPLFVETGERVFWKPELAHWQSLLKTLLEPHFHPQVEAKGTSVPFTSQVFIVTSNYSIEDTIGTRDLNLLGALKRRFAVRHKTEKMYDSEEAPAKHTELANDLLGDLDD